MNYYSLVLYFVILASPTSNNTPPTLNVHQRVDELKRKIKEQIDHKAIRHDLIKPIEMDDYAYEDIESQPITPIMEFDERKKDDKFKLPAIKTTKNKHKTTPIIRSKNKNTNKVQNNNKVGNSNKEGKSNKPEKGKKRAGRSKKRKIKSTEQPPLDSFYRRLLINTEEPLEWVHCQDLITPFFSGYKNDFAITKRLSTDDHSVRRFIQLLRLNTTRHTKEEIYSILYQISNLQLRLFQWDLSAINLLVSVLVKGKKHTLRNLNHGVKDLLTNWHLDIADTANLLKQARIFRPPCVRVSDLEGSTKTSRAVRYTKRTSPKSTCNLAEKDNCDT